MKTARILVACEFSGVVRDAFIARGFDAVSCDLLPSDRPGPHYQGDVRDILGKGWAMMIAHPPCTYLANSGSRWLYTRDRAGNRIPDTKRWNDMHDAAWFFWTLLNHDDIPHIAVENPIMHKHAAKAVGRRQDQVVQPWMFGHGESKATGLWLHGLPPLEPTNVVQGRDQRVWKLPPSEDRWKLRSTTYQGIADAMAKQWGDYLIRTMIASCKAVEQARKHPGHDYGNYIMESCIERVMKGHRTLEWTINATLGDLLVGNDGV